MGYYDDCEWPMPVKYDGRWVMGWGESEAEADLGHIRYFQDVKYTGKDPLELTGVDRKRWTIVNVSVQRLNDAVRVTTAAWATCPQPQGLIGIDENMPRQMKEALALYLFAEVDPVQAGAIQTRMTDEEWETWKLEAAEQRFVRHVKDHVAYVVGKGQWAVVKMACKIRVDRHPTDIEVAIKEAAAKELKNLLDN